MSNPTPRILAIDNRLANLLTLRATLTPEFELQFASSGTQGLAMAAESPPDLILIDLMMSEMDGYETCRRLKADPRLQDIPMIFLTELGQAGTACTEQVPSPTDTVFTPPILADPADPRRDYPPTYPQSAASGTVTQGGREVPQAPCNERTSTAGK